MTELRCATVDDARRRARAWAGNKRFVTASSPSARDGSAAPRSRKDRRRTRWCSGCADSRVPPEVVYDEGLGKSSPCGSRATPAQDPLVVGSIEYSISDLGSVVVVVLGHEECGAVKAAIDVAKNGTQLPGDLPAVVAPILPVVQSLVGHTRRRAPRRRDQGRT